MSMNLKSKHIGQETYVHTIDASGMPSFYRSLHSTTRFLHLSMKLSISM